MAQHEVKFAKIPLKELLEALTLIYETGYDFVDIIGVHDGDSYRDVVKISVEQEYYSERPDEDPDDDDDDPSRIKISLN